ncbi:MAG: 16S rRNA (guanine(527)-N(7))-methyltransferase RsmG [Burkholderiaceae bacterium]|nr:16S rRNA (guanine(527)-N(7))-methyltransferase RsmG [Burkholderiaceae bacterium]
MGLMSHDSRRAALRSGLESLALPADDSLVDRLLGYLDLLHKWNQAYNLSAVRDPQQMVHQHLLDCLAALPPLDAYLQGRDARILDVGSGAGLPGVVWALMRPGWSVCCVDAVAKKAGFVRQVAAELALRNLRAEHARVEQLRCDRVDVVVSRAFASLAEFSALTRKHLLPGGCWLAMKGKLPADEMAALPADVKVFHVEPLRVPGLDAQRCLVWMRPETVQELG